MIFDAELEQARARSAAFAKKLSQLAATRDEMARRLDRYTRYATNFESGLIEARNADEVWSLPVYRTSWWRETAWVENTPVDPANHQHIHRERERWSSIITRLTHLRDKLDRRIKEVEERKFRVEYWLLEKEETWGKLDRDTLRKQVRELLLAADELSQLVAGRKVPIQFDTRDDSPLGYVPVHKHKNVGRKVYLGARILGDQPEHLLDYYRALIVHELGHVLMHLKDSAREYRRLRRLMRDKITRAPHFFDIFNVLLDEQLERVLRDTKPDWQRWFNRLDFYTRRIPLRDLKEFLANSGKSDPDATIADLSARRLVKVYPDPRQPFATILSAGIFSEGLGFTRLYGFFAALRHRLPHATIREQWLRECLELIPTDFKTLDVFEVHALAVRVYKLVCGDLPGVEFVTLNVRRGGKRGTTAITLPGGWVPGRGSEFKTGKVVVLRAKKRKGGRTRGSGSNSGTTPPANPQGSDPEGGPPAPPTPPPPRPVPIPRQSVRGASKKAHARAIRRGEKIQKARVRSSGSGQAWMTGACNCSCCGKGRSKTGKLSARDKAQQARAEREASRWAKSRSSALQPKAKPEREPQTAKVADSETNDRDLTSAEQLSSTSTPAWSSPSGNYGRNKVLDQLVQEVRDEIDGTRHEPQAIDRMVPDAATAADLKNESDDEQFPPPDQILTLRPDRSNSLALTRSVRPFVNVLRPYLGVSDPARVVEERLTGGRRFLPTMLTKHLAYGETRLFADQRMVESDQHAEVFLAVLLDTSTSMKTDGRLERAKKLATLLAECLRDCLDVESAFLGFNQNVYRCGNHEEHSVSSLEPAGKTNEAAVLDYLDTQFLDVPRRRKAVLVISDGLPTACSVAAVRRVVQRIERERGARCLHVAVSGQEHPAYHRWVALGGDLQHEVVRAIGRAVACALR